MRLLGLSPAGKRLLAVLGLCVAFLVMASVFVPSPTRAYESNWVQPVSDPHKGLPLLGTLEHQCCLVRIYATDFGPRYSVYERTEEGERERELGVLLSAEKMAEHFPDLPLNGVEFGVQRQLMLAPVRGGRGGWEE